MELLTSSLYILAPCIVRFSMGVSSGNTWKILLLMISNNLQTKTKICCFNFSKHSVICECYNDKKTLLVIIIHSCQHVCVKITNHSVGN